MSDYDAIIIGGGISGHGLAWVGSVERGKRVLLLEAADWHSAASDNSLRIIHGGIRYLQTLNLLRSYRSLLAQSEIARRFPDAVRELTCYMPLDRSGLKSSPFVSLGLLVYKALYRGALGKRYPGAVCGPEKLPSGIDAPFGALQWQDLQLRDPSSFAAALRLEGEHAGATMLSEAVVQLVRQEESARYQVKWSQNGQEAEGSAPVVFDARGIRAIEPLLRSELRHSELSLQGVRAWNLVFQTGAPPDYALGRKSRAGRLLFATPRDGELAVGTWYAPYRGNKREAVVHEDEVDGSLEEIVETFSSFELRKDQLKRVEVGELPAVEIKNGEPVLLGSERILNERGYIRIISTKYTTFLPQARRAWDAAFTAPS